MFPSGSEDMARVTASGISVGGMMVLPPSFSALSRLVEPVPRYRLIRDVVVEFGEKMESSEFAKNEFEV